MHVCMMEKYSFILTLGRLLWLVVQDINNTTKVYKVKKVMTFV
jgi:hypothetical protein